MVITKYPTNEIERLKALKSYEILDTDEEQIYDQLTQLASHICETKISLLTLIDEKRVWFKSKTGLSVSGVSREQSFCGEAIFENKMLVINDARKDERFHENPIVTGYPNVVFYAGVPLTDNEGFSLGTLCVIDDNPKDLNEKQLDALQILASQVIAQFRLRRELAKKTNYEEQLSRLSEQVPGVIYQFKLHPDGTSTVPFASSQIIDLYELDPNEIKISAQKIFSRIHPEDFESALASLSKSARTLENLRSDYRVLLPNAGLRWLRGSAKPEKLPDGSVLWNGFINDVTDEKNLEIQLYQNSKLAALGEMASGVAHEINNPLSIIIGKTSLMQSQLSSTTFDREKLLLDINKVENTALRISKIIKGLTAFSRNAEKDAFNVVEVNNIIEDTLSLVSEKFKYASIDISVDCPPDISIECNATQIGQVLMNLLINSFDAVKSLTEKWIRLSVKSHGNRVVILVSDSGEGISPRIVQKIMEPFFTTKSVGEGTGLGLSLSKGLIDSHNGVLKYVDGAKNTTFSIELPQRTSQSAKKVA